MKRRHLIIGAGGLMGMSTIVGSGALSAVSATRDVSVAVANDFEAYLTLTQRGSGKRSTLDGPAGEINFDIPSSDDSEYGGTDPDGVGTDSVYRFAEDAASDQSGLFAVENSGTDPVRVFGSQDSTSGVPTVKIFDVTTGNLLTKTSPSATLSVGDQLVCGLEIDTEGIDPREEEYSLDLTINANSTQ